MPRDRTKDDRRRIPPIERHVHEYDFQPSGACICGQSRGLLTGVGVRKPERSKQPEQRELSPEAKRAEDDIIAQLVRHWCEKEAEVERAQAD